MGGKFWLAYLVTAAALLSATWVYAPAAGERMPDEWRRPIVDFVAKCTGARQGEQAKPESPAKSSTAVQPPESTANAATPPAPPAPAASAANEEEEDDSPVLKGVSPAIPGKASWGVTFRTPTPESPDGKALETVPGGRFFKIERSEKSGKDVILVGKFDPEPPSGAVRVSSEYLRCFTGRPESLSRRQRDSLRSYYTLRGAAEDRRRAVMRETTLRSPFANAAAAAVAEFKAKAREVERMSDKAGEAGRAAHYDLAQLRSKVQDLNAKHKAWKQAHAAELPDPDKDPQYLKLLEKAKAFIDPVAGLAF